MIERDAIDVLTGQRGRHMLEARRRGLRESSTLLQNAGLTREKIAQSRNTVATELLFLSSMLLR